MRQLLQYGVADLDLASPAFALLPAAQLEALRRALAPLWNLQALIRWGFAQSPSWDVVDVVVQDEFTHDVVMQAGAIYLVFDST
ncbi:MAG TPA: hypothetical protein PLF40_13955 [Kofleriaceae bacterium]|nr:hypothetical protein [Kofleriaceae bacterium]